MPIPILLITHDSLGSTLCKICEQIIVPLPTTIHPFDIPFGDNTEQYYQQALEICEQLCQEQSVLILTDLIGSTPANIAKRLYKKNQCIVITGLNLPMLLRALNYCHLNILDLVENTAAGGHSGIEIYDSA